jgi:hypothetical protein
LATRIKPSQTPKGLLCDPTGAGFHYHFTRSYLSKQKEKLEELEQEKILAHPSGSKKFVAL